MTVRQFFVAAAFSLLVPVSDCIKLSQIYKGFRRQHCPTVLTDDVNTSESRSEVLNFKTGNHLVLLIISVTLVRFAYSPPRFNDFWPHLLLT
jgi:hypothetical protein